MIGLAGERVQANPGNFFRKGPFRHVAADLILAEFTSSFWCLDSSWDGMGMNLRAAVARAFDRIKSDEQRLRRLHVCLN